MTRALLPGRWNRHGRAVPDVQPIAPAPFDARNCYMADADERAYAAALAEFRGVEEEHSLPALIWWALVSLAAVGSFLAGLLIGSRS